MIVPIIDINTYLIILSRLSDLVTCSERFNIQSEGSPIYKGKGDKSELGNYRPFQSFHT